MGRDDKHLSPGDSAGLALAAVEWLRAAALPARDQATPEPAACD